MSQMSKQIIHETSGAGGRHRLVVLKEGVPTSSPWFESRQVGLFKGIYFHVGAAGETIPSVFRVQAVPNEVL